MTHLSGHCTCGRRLHYPKNATMGSTWTCWKCGKTWTLSTHGDPLRQRGSKPPRKPEKPKKPLIDENTIDRVASFLGDDSFGDLANVIFVIVLALLGALWFGWIGLIVGGGIGALLASGELWT